MNNRTNITLCHIEDMDSLLALAKKSHGPVCLMDNQTVVADLREENVVSDVLRAISQDGGLNQLHLSIPAEDMPMYLYYLIHNAA